MYICDNIKRQQKQQLNTKKTYKENKQFNEIKWNEKLIMRLNSQCPELRGAANPNQARYFCPFAIPIRGSSMAGHGFCLKV